MKHLLRKFFLILQKICFVSIHIVKIFVKHTFGQTLNSKGCNQWKHENGKSANGTKINLERMMA